MVHNRRRYLLGTQETGGVTGSQFILFFMHFLMMRLKGVQVRERLETLTASEIFTQMRLDMDAHLLQVIE